MSTFEIWQNAQGEFYWKLLVDGEIVARSTGYLDRQGARMSAEKVKEWSSIPANFVEV